jgi:hypothetical protein
MGITRSQSDFEGVTTRRATISPFGRRYCRTDRCESSNNSSCRIQVSRSTSMTAQVQNARASAASTSITGPPSARCTRNAACCCGGSRAAPRRELWPFCGYLPAFGDWIPRRQLPAQSRAYLRWQGGTAGEAQRGVVIGEPGPQHRLERLLAGRRPVGTPSVNTRPPPGDVSASGWRPGVPT